MAAHDPNPVEFGESEADHLAWIRSLLSSGAAPVRLAHPGEPETHAEIRERVEQDSADRLAALEECRAAFRVIEIALRSGDRASLQDALETAETYGSFAGGFVEEACRRIYGPPPVLPAGVASLDDERARRAGRRA